MTRKTTTLWAMLALLTMFTFADAQKEGDRPRDGDRSPRDGGRAGGRDFRPSPPPLVVALDLDKDGEISTEEMEQATKSLKTLDKNKDGVLDHDELRPVHGDRGGHGPRDGEGRPPRDGDRPRGDGDRPPRDGDRQRDGDRPRGEGDRGGRGGAGRGGPGSGGPEAFVDRLMEADTDNDGKLSRKELLKAAEKFRGGRGGGGSNRPQRPE